MASPTITTTYELEPNALPRFTQDADGTIHCWVPVVITTLANGAAVGTVHCDLEATAAMNNTEKTGLVNLMDKIKAAL